MCETDDLLIRIFRILTALSPCVGGEQENDRVARSSGSYSSEGDEAGSKSPENEAEEEEEEEGDNVF